MHTSKLFISSIDIQGVKLIPGKKDSLNSNDIIIYKIYFPNFIGIKSDLINTLNSSELDRANRFYKDIDRNRFIICRSILKFVLAAHTKLDLKNIHIDYHSNKKPYLASHPWLFFNVSHSEDFAVIAISHNKVGIDLEYIAEDFNFTNILPEIFNDEEILEIQNASNKKNAFYTSWTRKEAFVKALGKGIDDDFKKIPCMNGEHTIDSTIIKTTKNWQVYSFNLEVHYLAAIAFEIHSTIPKNLVLYTIPNSIKDLQNMAQMAND